MQENEVVSHFWIGGPPFFSSTVLVGTGSAGELGKTIAVACDIYDVDGVYAQSFSVEFPERETGIIELEPFLAGLKMQAGIPQGHLILRSRAGTKHILRQQIGEHVDFIPTPTAIKSREMTCIQLLLGARREHLVTLLNIGDEVAQVVVRLLYGTRSPEWTVQIPGRGSRVISLEHELLSTFDDTSWHKGIVQGYLRISPRAQSEVVCQMIERCPGDSEEREFYRCVTSW